MQPLPLQHMVAAFKRFSKAFIILLFLSTTGYAQQQSRAAVNIHDVARPKLVVGLVIDQMRWDYLYRYFARYGNGGFKRLLKQGYSFQNTSIPYIPSVTAPGHTCIYSGSVPAIHGIAGNDWIDNRTGFQMYCTRDDSARSVGGDSWQGRMSPKNLLVTTVCDELRIATNFRSRSYGIAMKDRGGILASGRGANAAYWFDDATGKWISSSYYMEELPHWVQAFNNKRSVDDYMRIPWTTLYDTKTYLQSTADDKLYEKTLPHERTRTFPHKYDSLIGKNYYAFRVNPYGNTFTLDFAKELMKSESLGMKGFTDFLAISLSSTDYIGHRYGPNSMEVEDMYLRLDKDIEKFLNDLDKNYGKGNYLLFLSADHGASNVPGFMQENKLPGGNLRSSLVTPEINKMLKQQYGSDSLVIRILEYQVFFNNRRIDSLRLDKQAIKTSVVNFMLANPAVWNAWDYAAFDKLIMPEKIKEMFRKGYHRDRSGDVQFVLKSQYHDVDWAGAEHGTWHPYDTHIPLIFFGWNIKAGKTYRETYMTDIAPTLSALLHIQAPSGSIGKVLTEVVK